MIVKVQLSLQTTAPVRQVLIYNEVRTIYYQQDVTPEIAEAMGGDDKAFFFAKLRGTVVELNHRVGERDW